MFRRRERRVLLCEIETKTEQKAKMLQCNNPVSLSVCPSVTRWHQVKTTQARITKSSSMDSPRSGKDSQFLRQKVEPEIWKGSPRAMASNESGVGKIHNFQPISRRISETVQDITSYYWWLIRSRIRPFDCRQNQRLWTSLNGQYEVYCKKDASFAAHHKNLNEDRPILYYQRQKRRPLTSDSTFWQHQVNVDIRRSSLGRGRQTTMRLSRTAIFSVFAGYFFENFSDETSVIIWRYAVWRHLFSDPKMHDLEWTWRAISR